MARRSKTPLKVMVSSTVYLIEDLLEQVFASLETYGYEVMMSHAGTVFANPRLSAMDSCLKAVEECDVFFSLITPRYGSGKTPNASTTITHQELTLAIQQDKPRYALVHRNVVTARLLLNHLSFRKPKTSFRKQAGRAKLELSNKSPVVDSLGILDMYEEALLDGVPIDDRINNWVQQFDKPIDVLRFVDTQFGNVDRLRKAISQRGQP